MNKYFFISLLCMLLLSCNKQNSKTEQKILHVELSPKDLAASTLFKKIEVIPLETNEQCLLKTIGRVIEADNKYYILDDDREMGILFCFDKQGKFLSKIDKTGNGPGEYNMIYEVIANPEENLIHMLSPMGAIYTYTTDGQFIKRHLLPGGGGQTDMIEIDKGLIAYWTLTTAGDPTENLITFYDTNTEEIAGGFWKTTDDNFMTNMCIDVFYKYNNENYFSTQYSNEVYRFTKEAVELAYKWDFGSGNINLEPFKERIKEDPNVFPQLVDSHEVPYFFFRQFQNKDYYYTVLNTWNIDKWRNVFYRKKDGKSFVFDTLEGGAKVKKTSLFTDEYMICIVSPEEIGTLHNILPPEEFSKVKNLQEDDNLCLVKYYFK